MSRNVTQVTSHSPSHRIVGRLSSMGWPFSSTSGFSPSAQSNASSALPTSTMPYKGASNRPASSAITISAGRPLRRKIG